MSRTWIRVAVAAWLGALFALPACNDSSAGRAGQLRDNASVVKSPDLAGERVAASPRAAEAALQLSPQQPKAGSVDNAAKAGGKPPAPNSGAEQKEAASSADKAVAQSPAAVSLPKEPPTVAGGAEAPPSQKLPPAAAPEALPATVRVTLQTQPAVDARVRMGSKRLGTIRARHPLVIERPRDSGPLDLVIRATGFFPVHTRTYTFEDSEVTVKLTPKETPEELYGYRQPLEAPDAGAAPQTP